MRDVPLAPRLAPALNASGTSTAVPRPTSAKPMIAPGTAGTPIARARPSVAINPPSLATIVGLVRAVNRSAPNLTNVAANAKAANPPAAMPGLAWLSSFK